VRKSIAADHEQKSPTQVSGHAGVTVNSVECVVMEDTNLTPITQDSPFRLPHDEAIIAAKRREIAARYKCRERCCFPDVLRMRVRRRDLNVWFRATHGDTLPDNAIGRDLVFVLAHTVSACVPRITYGAAPDQDHAAAAIMAAALQWCPWLSHDDAAALADRVLSRPIRWTADALGRRLHLSDAERTALGITTIGGFDVPKAERLARRKAKDRTAKADKRRAKGARPRAESAARTKPWLALGMSRATWFRRGKPAVSTAVRLIRRQQASCLSAAPKSSHIGRASRPQGAVQAAVKFHFGAPTAALQAWRPPPPLIFMGAGMEAA
jgi:hypothetical protein